MNHPGIYCPAILPYSIPLRLTGKVLDFTSCSLQRQTNASLGTHRDCRRLMLLPPPLSPFLSNNSSFFHPRDFLHSLKLLHSRQMPPLSISTLRVVQIAIVRVTDICHSNKVFFRICLVIESISGKWGVGISQQKRHLLDFYWPWWS